VPAVVTPVGAQGLPGIEATAAVETNPAAFAAAVCDLLTDDELWLSRSTAARSYARERFSETTQRHSLLRALDIAVPTPAPEACVTEAAMA
jgi:hypothetical protein